MIEIISRKEAKARGLKHYFTGKPCKRGHIAIRIVREIACSECRKFYGKKYKDSRNASERARYAKNPEKHIAKVKRQYAKNGEIIRAKARAHHQKVYKDPEVRKAAQERTRQWALDHPEQARANARNAKYKRKNVPGQYTAADIAAIMKAQKRKCAYCRIKLDRKYHIDHIQPVSKGGTNDRSNLQITCVQCNLGKGARDPIFHAQTLGMLL